ncbi:MAG: hypothetical protein ACTSW1_04995 [Candidatus Hodarchaeales archaeon]
MVVNQSQFHKEWFSNVPILWKRKIKKYASSKRKEAIQTFVDLYSQQQFLKHCEFGLTILLPESLFFIIDSLSELQVSKKIRLIHLLEKKEFREEILRLETLKQKQLLLSIVTIWHNPKLNKDKVRSILLNLQPQLVDTMYNLLFEEKEKYSPETVVEILFTWGKPIFSRLFTLYLTKPHKGIKHRIKDIPSEIRVSAFQKVTNLSSLKNFNLEILLELFGISNDELSYLVSLVPNLNDINKQKFNNWFVEKVNPETCLTIKFPSQIREKFLYDYFIEKVRRKDINYQDSLKLVITHHEFELADSLIQVWDKKTNIQEILLDILIKEDMTDNSNLSFFKPKFSVISKKNLPKIIQYYLTATDSPLLDIFSSSIKNLAIHDWKTLLKVASTFSSDINHTRLINIFSEVSKQQKKALGTFLVTNKLLQHFMFLLKDFEIFRPILFSTKPFTLKELVQIDLYLQEHVKKHFHEIISLGNKITYPIDHIGDHFNDENIQTLVELVTSSKKLLTYWEPVLVDHYDIALKYSLNLIVKSSRTKKALIQLTKTLIDIDLEYFWVFYANTSSKSFRKLYEILLYAFDKSIQTLGVIIQNLSDQHNAFIIRKVLPEFSSQFSKILYPLFTFGPQEQIIASRIEYIQAMIKLDPSILKLTLIRCNKLLTTDKSFVEKLLEPNFKKHLITSFHTINSNKLENLVGILLKHISSLAINDLKDMLLEVIPSLGSEFLIKDLMHLLTTSFPFETNLANLLSLLDEFDKIKDKYSDYGTLFIQGYIKALAGKSTENDLRIFGYFQNKSQTGSGFLNTFLEKIPQNTIDTIISDPNIVISDRNIAKIILDEIESRHSSNGEKYFFKLFQNNTKDVIKRATIPKLGKYCTWSNLKILMQLPDQTKFTEEYEKALDNFASRYNLQSSKALVQIWQSGLKDVYGERISTSSLKQTECPNCGKPILEKQLNCGFCVQKLTCAICRQSIVRLDSSYDIVRCPNCSSFFHRKHLLDALQVRKVCPVCNAPLTYQKVTSLPKYVFGFL